MTPMPKPRLGLSLMLEPDFLVASMPLFENDEVDVLEWSPEAGWMVPSMPPWALELLQFYSQANSLYGHGVSFSPSSAEWTEPDFRWLESLKRECQERKFVHFSEHFGFSRTTTLRAGAPLPVPFTTALIETSQNRLSEVQKITGTSVGLENLALAFNLLDVEVQGQFLDETLEPSNGFLILDLHNLFCQSVNFTRSFDSLLNSYPLHRVKEIHISGGSWSEDQTTGTNKLIRRDTHDDAVPEELLDFLPIVLKKCPKVEVIIFERLGGTMLNSAAQSKFREDYRSIANIIESTNLVLLDHQAISDAPDFVKNVPVQCSIAEIAEYQILLVEALRTNVPAATLIASLQKVCARPLQPYIEGMEPRMIELGKVLMKKWQR